MATMTVSKVRELSRKLKEEIRQLSMQEVIQRQERQDRYLTHDREIVSSLDQAYGALPGVKSLQHGNYTHEIINGSRA